MTGFNVFNNGTEFGLILSYLALAGSPLSSADVLWSYNVTADAGTSITDAYVDLAPLITGSGQAGVSDVLDNLSQPITIVCTLAGCDPSNPLVVSFAPVSTIHVSKDQSNAVFGEAGTVITSEVTNAFSVSPVPLPASLPLFTSGLGLLAYLGRRRRKPMTEALA